MVRLRAVMATGETQHEPSVPNCVTSFLEAASSIPMQKRIKGCGTSSPQIAFMKCKGYDTVTKYNNGKRYNDTVTGSK